MLGPPRLCNGGAFISVVAQHPLHPRNLFVDVVPLGYEAIERGRQDLQVIIATGVAVNDVPVPRYSGYGSILEVATCQSEHPILTSLSQYPLPDAVYGLLELGAGRRSDSVEVRFGAAAHDPEVIFHHAAHDRIAVEQFGGLTDGPDSRPESTPFEHVYETAGGPALQCEDATQRVAPPIYWSDAQTAKA
jgi:hypothetical protein